ncbi:winged helix-turn-helix transcriptional regulator [Sphingobacterium bambusae]|uniref:Winged helix-turn-helix transcriptional regulator n=1 Tax=Sphingobacterium bambusae TaxID=662858 RepID=A0ABW6BCM1_9SPHI|nr:helix-turn-helix domain-containing protein [Sphingobacterium bambusae]WPL49140.1 helix-turn-helix domain-containing protein [Sphingobacterium bambusae]
MSHSIKESSTNQANKQQLAQRCNVNDTLSYIGKRWLMAILYEISIGHKQFSSLAGQLTGISEHILASRVRELEKESLITKALVPNTTPTQIHYTVTPKGYALLEVIDNLHRWSDSWKSEQ